MTSVAVFDKNTTFTTAVPNVTDVLNTTAAVVTTSSTTVLSTTSLAPPPITTAHTFTTASTVSHLTTAAGTTNQSDNECLQILYDQINNSGYVICNYLCFYLWVSYLVR